MTQSTFVSSILEVRSCVLETLLEVDLFMPKFEFENIEDGDKREVVLKLFEWGIRDA
jgi:hypothetical protein